MKKGKQDDGIKNDGCLCQGYSGKWKHEAPPYNWVRDKRWKALTYYLIISTQSHSNLFCNFYNLSFSSHSSWTPTMCKWKRNEIYLRTSVGKNVGALHTTRKRNGDSHITSKKWLYHWQMDQYFSGRQWGQEGGMSGGGNSLNKLWKMWNSLAWSQGCEESRIARDKAWESRLKVTHQQLPGFFSWVMPEMSLTKMGEVDRKE